jgi:hypothetical protein
VKSKVKVKVIVKKKIIVKVKINGNVNVNGKVRFLSYRTVTPVSSMTAFLSAMSTTPKGHKQIYSCGKGDIYIMTKKQEKDNEKFQE